MRKILLIILGLGFICSSASSETIGDYIKYLGEQNQNSELTSPVPLAAKDPDKDEEIQLVYPSATVFGYPPACPKADACYERTVNQYTVRLCPDGPGKIDVFLLFGTTPVSLERKNCGENEPGTCNAHCSGN